MSEQPTEMCGYPWSFSCSCIRELGHDFEHLCECGVIEEADCGCGKGDGCQERTEP